jgi:hypothetical protein
MDYSKSGNANLNKPAPARIPTKGAPKGVYGQPAAEKAALLAKMKAAAAARKG